MSDILALIAKTRTHAELCRSIGGVTQFEHYIALADALEAEHARAEDTDKFARQMVDAKNAVIADLNKAQARIAALEAALEPFAELDRDGFWEFERQKGSTEVDLCHLTKARAVLEKAE